MKSSNLLPATMVLPSAAITATSQGKRRIVFIRSLIFLCFLYDLPGFTEAAIGPTQLRRGFYSSRGEEEEEDVKL